MEKDQDREDPDASKRWAYYWQIGLQFPITMGITAWLGYQFDKKFSSLPWGTLVGVFLGMAAAAYQLFVLLKWDERPRSPKDRS